MICIQNGENYNSSSGYSQSSNIQQNPSPSPSAISKSLSKSTEPIESVEDDSLNSKPYSIHTKVQKIKQDIYQLTNKQYPNIDLKLGLKRKILKISVISDQEVNRKYFIDLLRSIDFNDYELPIKKVNMNHIDNLNHQYWQYKFSLDSIAPWAKKYCI